ncbi:MAG: trypsin-like peptidase domain-containing protein [Acidobacteria bacterium]|nr:trypsin-like peptidase domain-containing protein [Acidobacteriota bacterium]
MEPRILIRNLSATKAGQTEDFPAGGFRELTVGRDPSCEVRFDPNDDLVSRRHAKISASPADPAEYTVADLGSRNGTFVNRQRIFGPVKLNCGDRIQLGAGGPEFEFDLDPRPAGMVKATRLADSAPAGPLAGMQPTREGGPGPFAAPAGVGKATVERMIGETRRQSRTLLYTVAGGLLVIVIALAMFIYIKSKTPNVVVQRIEQKLSPSGLSPTQIAQSNTDSVVKIECGWKLIDTVSGKQLSQVAVPNRVKDKEGKVSERVPGAGEVLPVFLVLGDKLEPLLTTADNGGQHQPVGGLHSGTGFVVSNDGFMLTNRHVAAAWHAPYGFPAPAGLAVVMGPKGPQKVVPISRDQFPSWIPSQAKLVTSSGDLDSLRQIPQSPQAKTLEGRNDYLDVTFAKNRIRIPAKLARISDRIDVAMIKIDLPQTMRKVELNDNYDSIKVGDPVVCLGYPAVSLVVVGVVASRDPLNQQASAKEIPDPTLSVGNIARVIRGQVGLTEASIFGGDIYQLTINSTGHGNSGGPLFDERGRVVGIFTLGWSEGTTAVTAAIPIRYGMELMGVQRATP